MSTTGPIHLCLPDRFIWSTMVDTGRPVMVHTWIPSLMSFSYLPYFFRVGKTIFHQPKVASFMFVPCTRELATAPNGFHGALQYGGMTSILVCCGSSSSMSGRCSCIASFYIFAISPIVHLWCSIGLYFGCTVEQELLKVSCIQLQCYVVTFMLLFSFQSSPGHTLDFCQQFFSCWHPLY